MTTFRPRVTDDSVAMSPYSVEHPAAETMSGGRVMGWLFELSSLFWPRVVIIAFWIFSDLLGEAYGSWLLPMLGFFVLPWSTMTYAMMWSISSDGVNGAEWLAVAVALGLDLATYAGWRRLRS